MSFAKEIAVSENYAEWMSALPELDTFYEGRVQIGKKVCYIKASTAAVKEAQRLAAADISEMQSKGEDTDGLVNYQLYLMFCAAHPQAGLRSR